MGPQDPQSTYVQCSGSEARGDRKGRCSTLENLKVVSGELLIYPSYIGRRKGSAWSCLRRTKNITGTFLASARLPVRVLAIEPTHPNHHPWTRPAFRPLSGAKIGTETVALASRWRSSIRSEGVGNRDGAQAVCEVDGWDNWTRRRQGHAVALLSKPTAAVSDAAPDQAVIGDRQPFPAALRCAVGSVSQAPEFRSERRAGGGLLESG